SHIPHIKNKYALACDSYVLRPDIVLKGGRLSAPLALVPLTFPSDGYANAQLLDAALIQPYQPTLSSARRPSMPRQHRSSWRARLSLGARERAGAALLMPPPTAPSRPGCSGKFNKQLPSLHRS